MQHTIENHGCKNAQHTLYALQWKTFDGETEYRQQKYISIWNVTLKGEQQWMKEWPTKHNNIKWGRGTIYIKEGSIKVNDATSQKKINTTIKRDVLMGQEIKNGWLKNHS